MMRSLPSRVNLVTALLCAVAVLASSRMASAQVGRGAGVNRPSMTTLRSLDNTLGNYVRYGGSTSLGGPSEIASVSPQAQPGSVGSRRGLGSPLNSRVESSMTSGWEGASSSRRAGLYSRRGSGLLAGGTPFIAPMPTSAFANIAQFDGTRNKPGLLLRRGGEGASESSVGTGAEPLAAPDVAVRRELLPQAGQVAGPQVPLEQLVQNYVGSRREAYMAQGWQRFRERQYRVATDLFGMADSVSANEPAARIPIKRAIVIAGIASRQYALAGNALEWLLSDDAITKSMRDGEVLQNAAALVASYGTTQECRADFAEHVSALTAVANANPASAETQALRVVLLLEQNDRMGADFYVRKMTEDARKLLDSGQVSTPEQQKIVERFQWWGDRLGRSLQQVGSAKPAVQTTATGPAVISMDDSH